MLVSCGETDVNVCETDVVEKLASPSTYRRLSVNSYDSQPMTLAEFRRATGTVKPKTDLDRIAEEGSDGHQLALRTMYIEYEAENTYGTPIRGIAECGFRLIDGALESEDKMRLNASLANYEESIRALWEVQVITGTKKTGEQPRPKGKFGCCL